MKILIVVGTNFELYYLSSVVHLLKTKDGQLEFRLLLPCIFKDNLTPEIRNLYSQIDLFKMPANSFPIDKNPIKTFQNIIDNFKDLWTFRKQMKKTLFDVDIVCLSGYKEFFANVLYRVAPENVRLVVLRMANQKSEKPAYYQRRPILSFLLNIKNFLFGYSTMRYKWSSDSKNFLITKNFVKYPYHRTISMTDFNFGKDGSDYRLPSPFVALKKIYRVSDEVPAILIALDKIPVYDNWSEQDQKKYQDFLDYLRNNFKDYKLYFKTKRGEKNLDKYKLEGFQILNPDISLEEACLKNNIKKVISIRSTSSKLGVYLGGAGYLLYPLFKFPKEIEQFIENEHYDMQSVIRVNKFEDLKKNVDSPIKKYDFDTLASLYWEAIIK